MVNYQEGKIYKIVCNITGLVYIGSTCKQYLSQRLQNHKSEYNMFKKNGKRYMSSFKVLENGDYNILLLELYPCNTKDELHARERYYMETIECVNLQIVGRTPKEWKNDNKDKVHEIYKRHYKKNGEVLKEKCKEYRDANKDRIAERDLKSVLCDCGSYYTHCHKSRHERTIKHQTFLNQPMNGQQ